MHRTTQRKDPLLLYETVNVFSKHVFSKLVDNNDIMLECLHLRQSCPVCCALLFGSHVYGGSHDPVWLENGRKDQ